MNIARALRLYLGLRIATGHDTPAEHHARGFLEEIERLEKEHPIPLYWTFPVAPVLEKQSRKTVDLIGRIRRRVLAGEDRIIPSGFTGAPNQLLQPEELRHELLWCYRNPWFPALKNLFDAKPEIVLPVYPDLCIEAITSVYSRQGFTTIGIPIPLYRVCPSPGKSRWTDLRPLATPAYSFRGGNSEVTLRPIVLLHPQEVTPEGINALISACGGADALALMLDLADDGPGTESAEPEAVKRLLGLLSRHRRIEFHPFPSGTPESSFPEADPDELLKFLPRIGPAFTGRSWDEIEVLRKRKRKSNLQTRELLNKIAAAVASGTITRVDQTEDEEPGSIEITNISMAGSVTLIGIGLQATFNQGRLSNLIDHGEEILPGEPGRSVFALGSRRENLKTDSAFSFDREGQTGLRSVLSGSPGQKGKGVQVILDYSFAEESNGLTVEISARYPSLPSEIVTESTPLELCLCAFTEDDRPQIEVKAPNRAAYNHRVTADSQVFVLAGKAFLLRHGSRTVELLAAPSQQTRTEQCEFRVEKKRTGTRGGACLLWANLGGSYLPQPAAGLSGRRLNLSYGIRFSAARGRGKRS